MDTNSALRRLAVLERNPNRTEDEDKEYIQINEFLLEETNNAEYAENIGGYYYETRSFDLALKYYELAEKLGSNWVTNALGYIWYYGRCGEVNYEKAYHYFEKTLNNKEAEPFTIREASFKIADMYKNGYYVEKDYDRYVSIIEDLYNQAKEEESYDNPEIFLRYASIQKEKGNLELAKSLLYESRSDLAWRLTYNVFFGELTRMKYLIKDLYEITEFDESYIDFYDLYYLLTKPCKVGFYYEDKEYFVESVLNEDNSRTVLFNGNTYKSIDDFFYNAAINGKKLVTIYFELDEFEIVEKTI